MTTTLEAPVTTGNLTAKGVLYAAKDLLLTDGWTQGRFWCDTGARCASGALRAVALPFDLSRRFSGGNSRPNPDSPEFEAYAEATLALATAMEEDWEASYIESMTTGERNEGILDPDEIYTPRNLLELVEAAEDNIFGYNDSRVKTDAGRDEVLAKFDQAIASL